MLYNLMKKIDSKVRFKEARAHCDIPCGIYDPITAQIDALTVVRMMDLMARLQSEGDRGSLEYENSMGRYITVKEEHAEKCKHEIRVIMGDMIKPNHLEAHPGLQDLVQKIFQLGSAARQTTDRQAGLDLVGAVNEFAEIFWKIKEIPVKRAKAPYAPNLEMVYPQL